MTHLYIAGLGMQTPSHLTRQAELALRSSAEILYLDTGIAARPFLESLCPRVTSLYDESYRATHPRLSAYEHMAIRIIQSALDHPPVAFAIHGHPLVAAIPPFLVLQLAAALDLNVQILPGISALDTLLADLRLDPVVHGIQMYEATDLLLRRRPLQNDVPAILWQIGPLETALHSQHISRPQRFARLVAYLRQYYPANHQVTALYCPPHPLLPPAILRFAIQDMGNHAAEIHTGFTLYVPPTISRPVQDYDLAANLYSLDHLKSIVHFPEPQ